MLMEKSQDQVEAMVRVLLLDLTFVLKDKESYLNV